MKLHSVGKRKAASALHNISSSPPECTVTSRGSLQNDISYSAKEALALFTQLKLTRLQYIELRASAIRKNMQNLYPPYYKLLEEKAKCYPPNIQITDISAEVPLQNLVDHTVSRIAENQKELLVSLNNNSELEITYKWGADGSGSQKNYKQKFEKDDSDDSNVFITSLVPLRLHYSQENNYVIIWQNPRTNSTRFCRPIKLQFVKETSEVINSEFANMDRQIANLTPTKIELCGRTYIFKHNLLKTMIDGKICNALSSNKSTQRCYICKATTSEFNKIVDLEPRLYDPQTLDFGISPLHATIRFFECLLHISYKLPVKSWQVRGEENKKIVADRKRNIQKQFREKLGLLVDVPKQGFGNTNDGNTARRFFANPDIVHEITGIDRDLIIRFGIILKTLSCPYKINSALFDEYARDTAKQYISLYGWYCMPPTVHKVLIHGKDIIDHFLLPIGQLGEDAQECRHKDVKYYREHNTRKMSRKQTNEDLFKILLVSSDPQISILRPLPQKQKGIFPAEVIKLLEQPNFDLNEEEL
ncbi:hypothetical protein ABMA28_000592 [Loxostege sticticalis]|uniref:V(D)J recombination-activating protein 1 RNase H domain-containing protein n=1 Tax=Loxostege sticticalis TaxID=481309 RepID=A0ABD0TT38_LOXSC